MTCSTRFYMLDFTHMCTPGEHDRGGRDPEEHRPGSAEVPTVSGGLPGVKYTEERPPVVEMMLFGIVGSIAHTCTPRVGGPDRSSSEPNKSETDESEVVPQRATHCRVSSNGPPMMTRILGSQVGYYLSILRRVTGTMALQTLAMRVDGHTHLGRPRLRHRR